MSDRDEQGLPLLQPLYNGAAPTHGSQHNSNGHGSSGLSGPPSRTGSTSPKPGLMSMPPGMASAFPGSMGGIGGGPFGAFNGGGMPMSLGLPAPMPRGPAAGAGAGNGNGASGGVGGNGNGGGSRIDYTSLPHAPTYSTLSAPAPLLPMGGGGGGSMAAPAPVIVGAPGIGPSPKDDPLTSLGVSGDVLKMAAGIGIVNGMDELQMYRTTLNNAAFESKQKARNALARYLSGFWDGRSIRETEGPNGQVVQTVTEWTNCELVFNIIDGRITGSGQSVWQKESIPFIISGAFDRKLTHVHLIKTHVDPKYHTVTHYSLALITTASIPRMEGTYKLGRLELRKTAHAPNRAAAPAGASAAGAGVAAPAAGPAAPKPALLPSSGFSAFDSKTAPAGGVAGKVPAIVVTPAGDSTGAPGGAATGSNGPSPAATPAPMLGANNHHHHSPPSTNDPKAMLNGPSTPAPVANTAAVNSAILKEFLFTLFGSKTGPQFLAMLEENEIDWDALRLMNESHLKELGFSMGPRVKIINSIGKWKASASALAGVQPNAASFPAVPSTPTGTGTGGSAVNSPAAAGNGDSSPSQTASAGVSGSSGSPGRGSGTMSSMFGASSAALSSSSASGEVPLFYGAPVPAAYVCPLSHELMAEPATAADGNNYESRNLQRALATPGAVSPVTGKPFANKDARPNLPLRNAIREWKEQQIQNALPNSQLSLPVAPGSGAAAAGGAGTGSAMSSLFGMSQQTTILNALASNALSPKLNAKSVGNKDAAKDAAAPGGPSDATK